MDDVWYGATMEHVMYILQCAAMMKLKETMRDEGLNVVETIATINGILGMYDAAKEGIFLDERSKEGFDSAP